MRVLHSRNRAGARDELADHIALRSQRAIGTTATVVVTKPSQADRAATILRDELVAIDRTCSRFRPDSELSRLHLANGGRFTVSPLLFDAIAVALDVARLTDGAVDPTVGTAIEALGYDRDFDDVAPYGAELAEESRPASGWWRVELDSVARTVRLPAATHLDLGSSAKALVADRAARRIADTVRAGVLVSIGGDVATAGPSPEGGWTVGIALDSSTPLQATDQVVVIETGGIASSSASVRTWQRGQRRLHHIIDPATGDSVEPYWALVSASGVSCVAANAVTTASLVWGGRAVPKLVDLGQPTRLVRRDGQVIALNGWPCDGPSVAEANTPIANAS